MINIKFNKNNIKIKFHEILIKFEIEIITHVYFLYKEIYVCIYNLSFNLHIIKTHIINVHRPNIDIFTIINY